MKKNKAGRPSIMRDVIFETLQALPEDGSPIRFKDLRKVNMSSATLSTALLYLCSTGQATKSQVHSHRGKGFSYQRAHHIADWKQHLKSTKEQLLYDKQQLGNSWEWSQAQILDSWLSMIDKLILDVIFSHSQNPKKDLDISIRYIIVPFIKDLTTLTEEPFSFSEEVKDSLIIGRLFRDHLEGTPIEKLKPQSGRAYIEPTYRKKIEEELKEELEKEKIKSQT